MFSAHLHIFLHNIHIYLAVFLTILMAYEIPKWIPKKNECMKILCEVLVFLFCEITVWVSVFKFVDNMILNQKTLTFISFDAYFMILLPVINTLIHSTMIYHSICGVSEILFLLQKYKHSINMN